jgi:Putative zinc-finger
VEEPEVAMPADVATPADAAVTRPGDPPGPSINVVCRQVVELVTDYLEGALPVELRAAVERHLQLCPPCVTYLEQMRTTAASLREVPVESISPGMRMELVSAFRELIPPSATRGDGHAPSDAAS